MPSMSADANSAEVKQRFIVTLPLRLRCVTTAGSPQRSVIRLLNSLVVNKDTAAREERVHWAYVLRTKESVMRYFFDIHLNGRCQLDEHCQDFRSLEDARNYVITCGRICLTDGLPRERSVLAQCIIEITNRDGVSDVVMLADMMRPHRNPRRVLERAAQTLRIG